MKRILSGIRPTGGLHLGNYLGSLKQWIELSNEGDAELFFMVADYHALAPEKKIDLTTTSLDLLAWEVAAGLDPSKATLFLQSSIPAHNDLTRILSTLVSVSELQRMTQYKDLLQQETEVPSAALLMYPVLMAADILLYKAQIIPVGDDQEQHVEMCRTLARRLNGAAEQEIVPVPMARLTDASRIMSLHDPTKKMAKSLPQGALSLEDDEATLRAKISRAVTDTGPQVAPLTEEQIPYGDAITPEQQSLLFQRMSPGVHNLFLILKETSTDTAALNKLLHDYKSQSLQYKDLKQAVADAVVAFMLPMQTKYREIRANETELRAILADGTERAKQVADQTLREAKDLFHILDLNA